MSRSAAAVLVLAALLFVAPPNSAAKESVEEIDVRLLTELRFRSPAAADTFALAIQARDARDHEAAAALFHRVGEIVPDFSAALRREAMESSLVLGRRTEAIDRARQAHRLEETSFNLYALGFALAAPVGDKDAPEADLTEAAVLIRRAGEVDPKDAAIASLACQLDIMTSDVSRLGSDVERFVSLDPRNPVAYYFRAIHLQAVGDRPGALKSADQARILGMTETEYQAFIDQMEKNRSPLDRYAGPAGLVLAVWLAGFLVLLVVGSLLSRAALNAARRVPTVDGGRATGLDAGLRVGYRWVLLICCAYYYVSIPFVILLVLGIGGGLIYSMFAVGHIPIKLVLIVGFLTLATLWAILKSIFVRGRDEDPGRKAEPGANPRLRKVLDDVAARIGTRPVTNVYMTPGTEIAVMERGGILKQLNGHSERCLILGIAALDGMRMRPFRAILAHEYGHFSNRDTAGGGFALAVRRSLITTAVHLAQGGAATWLNPAWLFVNGFYRLFLLVSQGASRLQEVLADRWAAFGYGAAAFKEGLRHVIDRSIRFNVHADSVLTEVIEGKKALANLYAYQPSKSLVEEPKLAEALEEAINAKPSPFDSHPRPADRFAWVEALHTDGGPAEPDDREDAWSLFDNRQALETIFTDLVRHNLREGRGIVIPAEEAGVST